MLASSVKSGHHCMVCKANKKHLLVIPPTQAVSVSAVSMLGAGASWLWSQSVLGIVGCFLSSFLPSTSIDVTEPVSQPNMSPDLLRCLLGSQNWFSLSCRILSPPVNHLCLTAHLSFSLLCSFPFNPRTGRSSSSQNSFFPGS